MANVYNTSKPLFHKGRIKTLTLGDQPYPVHVQLIISDFCNHDCSFCAYRMSGYTSNTLFQIEEGQSRKARNPKRMIPKEKCFEIIDDCVEMGVKALQFTGGGEPTVHPDFVEIATYAQSKGLQTALVTNGNLLYKPEIRRVALKMTWVRVSIDASHPLSYCEVRGVKPKAWELLEEGCREFAKENFLGLYNVTFGAGFVTTPDNWSQIPEAVKLYKEWGFDNVRLGLMFNPDNSEPYKDTRHMIEALAKYSVKTYSDSMFQVINRTSEKLSELDQGTPTFDFCSYQHFTTYIGGDLNVYRCCVYAYHPKGIVGQIRDKSFKQLWDSEEKERNMADFNAQGCERCQFTDIILQTNDAIAEKRTAEGDRPPHVNFT